MPINDDEIVDCSLSVQILSGKDVTFLTTTRTKRSAPVMRALRTSCTCEVSGLPRRRSRRESATRAHQESTSVVRHKLGESIKQACVTRSHIQP